MSGSRHRRQRPEAAIHAAVCDHLRLRAKPDVLWLHPANGGTRDIREAARFSVWACSPGPATCCSGIAAIPSHSN